MTQKIGHPWKVLKQLSIPIWFYYKEEDRIHLNTPLKQKLSAQHSSFSLDDFAWIIHPNDVAHVMEALQSQQKEPFYLNYRLKVDGQYIWVEDMVAPYHESGGTCIGYTGQSLSLTSYKEELEGLKRSVIEIGQSFSANVGQPFFDYLVKYLAKILQVETVLIGELTSGNVEQITAVSMFHKGAVSKGFTYLVKNTPCVEVVRGKEYYIPQRAYELYPEDELFVENKFESYFGAPLLNSKREVIGVLAIMDTSLRKNGPMSKALFRIFADRMANELSKRRTERELKHISQFDPLTGLVSRNYFKDLLAEQLDDSRQKDQQLAMIFIDLDNFKMINDTWGHERGDELLKQFASHLNRIFARMDCIISRISSDEFAVLLRGESDVVRAREKAEDIIHSMRRPFFINKKEYYSTASVGVALYPQDAEEEEALLRYSDAAMHKAKRKGKNRYELYNPYMSEEMIDEMQRKQALHHALERREFTLHYQPQVCGITSKINGYEALIRWNQPLMGLLTPDHFISLAEESGAIIPIGEWVLIEACQQVKQWQEEFNRPDLHVSVNLSAEQFADRYLKDKIFKALRLAKLNANCLIIEITETMVLRDFGHSSEILEELRGHGIQVHLDDFGVGFSSMNYLSRLPVDAIKIDRSFIRQIGSDTSDVAIVSAIIAMAKSLNLQIIAEGVETEEHIDYLSDKGCHEYQGYYYSKPLPVKSVQPC
ncbi:GGDEF domain-containing phosphodiesterase [Halobacillus ihumii]|uniref:GGDEF domain-containing phosphodiesterase n=1 Tax=Halobacillus ihumii TaxID=2686092 RepID=UPI0013D1E892|nr:GGDEF domain-containing phosphodiesterase [Halobacillus ihumii]